MLFTVTSIQNKRRQETATKLGYKMEDDRIFKGQKKFISNKLYNILNIVH